MDSLPAEIILHILNQLNFTDLLICNQVCKAWYRVCNASIIRKKITVALRSDVEVERALNTLRPDNNILRLCLETVTFTLTSLSRMVLWSQLQELQLKQVDISSQALTQILLECEELRELGLCQLRDAFLVGDFLSKPDTVQALQLRLAHVWKLDLSDNPYLTDALFNRILAALPGLKSLSLDTCRVLHHPGIYKKYYPDSQGSRPSPTVLTFRNVLCKIGASKVKQLSLYNTGADDTVLEHLAAISGITELNLAKCTGITQTAVLHLVEKQPALRNLNLGQCRRIFVDSPDTSVKIMSCLSRVECLNINDMTIPRDFDVMMSKLDRLRELTFQNMDASGTSLARGLALSKSRDTLQVLVLSNNSMSPENLVQVISQLRRLKHLDLAQSEDAVNDEVLTTIGLTLQNLEHLDISGCTNLTDAGFTGCAHNPAMKSLTALLMCELKVTDVVFQLAPFWFVNLRYIDISDIPMLTSAAYEHLGQIITCLEVLKLMISPIDDNGLERLLRGTKRLTELDLGNCPNITYQGLSAALINRCSWLRKLNVSFCSGMKPHQIEELRAKMPFLCHVNMLGIGNLHAHNPLNIPPPPPFIRTPL